jgi:hypothetical protein
MQQNRRITNDEVKVLEYLLKLANFPVPIGIKLMTVRSLEDGGMGSFLILENPKLFEETRKFGAQISEFQYIDDDNVPVLVSLNVDSNGGLFEVDIWKADYSPVLSLKIPTT